MRIVKVKQDELLFQDDVTAKAAMELLSQAIAVQVCREYRFAEDGSAIPLKKKQILRGQLVEPSSYVPKKGELPDFDWPAPGSNTTLLNAWRARKKEVRGPSVDQGGPSVDQGGPSVDQGGPSVDRKGGLDSLWPAS
jgi:hypothetical protein